MLVRTGFKEYVVPPLSYLKSLHTPIETGLTDNHQTYHIHWMLWSSPPVHYIFMVLRPTAENHKNWHHAKVSRYIYSTRNGCLGCEFHVLWCLKAILRRVHVCSCYNLKVMCNKFGHSAKSDSFVLQILALPSQFSSINFLWLFFILHGW